MPSRSIPVLKRLVRSTIDAPGKVSLFQLSSLRWISGGVLLLAMVFGLTSLGNNVLSFKQANPLLAGAVALIVLLRYLQVGWALKRSSYLVILSVLAGLSLMIYFNFFAFHGPRFQSTRTFVHWHEVAHYYLGAKYYGELGYTGLYAGMLQAEAELNDDHLATDLARDLKTYQLLPTQDILEQGQVIKTAFTPQRWATFQQDVAYFRRAIGERYHNFLLDHGFNATPMWALLGGTLAQLTPTEREAGLLLLASIDLMLLVGAFAAMGWAFGAEALLLSVIYFGLVFGARFDWTGGAFLRYLWFLGVMVGLSSLHRKHYRLAGAMFALAIMLRVFPVLFVVPIGFKAAAFVIQERRLPPPRYRHFFGSLVLTAVILFALTGLLPRGWFHWLEFQAHMSTYTRNIASNVIGLTQILLYPFQLGKTYLTLAEFLALKNIRQLIYLGQLALVFLPLLILAARRSRRYSDVKVTLLALPLLFTGLNLASYYYVFLIILILIYRHSPRHLALIFAAEVVSYNLLLFFEYSQGVLFVYRNVIILLLYLILCLAPIRQELQPHFRQRLAIERNIT